MWVRCNLPGFVILVMYPGQESPGWLLRFRFSIRIAITEAGYLFSRFGKVMEPVG